ncbi:MAG: peptidase M14 [Acidobacteria bacterium]|nr:peptidase M14 [Acidobacteriota bacterium]
MSVYSQTPEKFAEVWDKEHVSNIFPSDARHTDVKKVSRRSQKSSGIKVDQVGFSNANREIYQVEWGRGPLKVFMWSQMHGDEPTATSALIDMFTVLQKHRDADWVKKIAETMTIRAVPMLNPDGAELYQRRNLQGIDINRDAIDLKTPEARLLKQLRDNWNPSIGFNLHNQQALTTVGRTQRQAAISFLVVFGDEAKTTSPGHERNARIASAMTLALQKFIPNNIARYSDEWTPTAFGDNFSALGTPTILIETGALHGKDEMYLVKMNFIAFLTALQSIATGSEASVPPSIYVTLPENTSGGLVNFVFRRANVVSVDRSAADPLTTITTADISAVTERRRASFSAPVKVRGIGDLPNVKGLDEYDASGFNVVQRFGRTKVGELAEFFFYKRDRTVEWAALDLEKQFPPDAIFSGGKWIKGEKLFPRR